LPAVAVNEVLVVLTEPARMPFFPSEAAADSNDWSREVTWASCDSWDLMPDCLLSSRLSGADSNWVSASRSLVVSRPEASDVPEV